MLIPQGGLKKFYFKDNVVYKVRLLLQQGGPHSGIVVLIREVFSPLKFCSSWNPLGQGHLCAFTLEEEKFLERYPLGD